MRPDKTSSVPTESPGLIQSEGKDKKVRKGRMGVATDSRRATERKIWGTMGRTFRDKGDIREGNLSIDERTKHEGCASNLECYVLEEVFLVITIGGIVGRLKSQPHVTSN